MSVRNDLPSDDENIAQFVSVHVSPSGRNIVSVSVNNHSNDFPIITPQLSVSSADSEPMQIQDTSPIIRDITPIIRDTSPIIRDTSPLASIQKVHTPKPIIGRDKIVTATVQGFTVVVNKTDFFSNDETSALCIFFEPDALLVSFLYEIE